ncbi:hypothetical protein IVB30_02845 [Bradyrhizobium sp. 200]|uniref:hypothetical protein n=1 Tax=Bradyrhizobium sp. 200 TaxID=2782665 RepID=UPI001FFEB0D5|nr:hypothetical protein [Bradyrhizobium sp. 200]UPJ50388.1 hypothetical protein IVB30_02845 [Bradyrhizobium sp. 200]
MSLEQTWRDFVCDPTRPGRFFSNVGRAVGSNQAEEIDGDVLNHFLTRLAGGGADVDLLATAVDLSRPGYVEFFTGILPPLLDALANERVGADAVVGPGLKGNPLWSATTLARKSGRIPQTHYVTRLPERSFSLPENLLVRWLVGSTLTAIELLEQRLGSGALPDRLFLIRTAAREAFVHHWFGEVESPRLPTSDMMRAAKRQRNSAYRFAAELAERRAARSVGAPTSRWLRTLDLLRVNWLAPDQSDDLFELYALTLVLDILERDFGLGPPIEFGLSIPGRAHVALFESAEVGQVRVYFDQSPHTVLGERSRYREIISAHSGTLGSARRPDVAVARYAPNSDRPIVLLIEVKESRDSAYTSDSIYKALGYAFDYLSLWEIGPSCPKVVLMFPEEIARRPESNLAALDVTLLSSLDRAALSKAVGMRLGLVTTDVG